MHDADLNQPGLSNERLLSQLTQLPGGSGYFVAKPHSSQRKAERYRLGLGRHHSLHRRNLSRGPPIPTAPILARVSVSRKVKSYWCRRG